MKKRLFTQMGFWGMALLLIFVGCGTSDQAISHRYIQKRKYNKGWHVYGKSKTPQNASAKKPAAARIEPVNTISQEVLLADFRQWQTKMLPDQHTWASVALPQAMEPFQVQLPRKKVHTSVWNTDIFAAACDILVMNNGMEIEAKILEVGVTEVRYRLCNSGNDSPIFTVSKREIHMIKFMDGQASVITPTQSSNVHTMYSSNENVDTGKSQLAAALLCFFVGILGIHRFYLGHIGIGLIQLLTLGLCGIWTLIDFILICTGDLKPVGGEYSKKF